MARKNDILSIYTREVEEIKEDGFSKGSTVCISAGSKSCRWKMEENFFVCVRITTLDLEITRD